MRRVGRLVSRNNVGLVGRFEGAPGELWGQSKHAWPCWRRENMPFSPLSTAKARGVRGPALRGACERPRSVPERRTDGKPTALDDAKCRFRQVKATAI